MKLATPTKIIFFALSLILANSAMAWEPLINCDGGLAEVDRQVQPGGYSIYQLVLRGGLASWAVNYAGVPSSFENQSGELIIQDAKGYYYALGNAGMEVHFGPSNQLVFVRLQTSDKSLQVTNGTNPYNFQSCSISQ